MMRKYLFQILLGLCIISIAAYIVINIVDYPEVRNLPLYTLSTVTRILVTLLLSIAWGVPFGILAASNRLASLFLTPIIDLLQSVPILGYFPIVLSFLFTIGPLGVELSILVLLFTSMAWSIFFGVLGAVRGVPANIVEASRGYGLTGWKHIRHVILPAITPSLISGANLAWSDGWFFMIAAEYIQYKGNVIVPPSGGLGYLLARAAYYYEDMNLALILLFYITILVLVINSLTWRKLTDRVDRGSLRIFLSSGLSGVGKLRLRSMMKRFRFEMTGLKAFGTVSKRLKKYSRIQKIITLIVIISSIYIVLSRELHHLPTWETFQQGLRQPPADQLVNLPSLIIMTMGRLMLAYSISLGFALGLGIMAAEHEKLAAVIYPIYDIGQGVPILALFPVVFLWLNRLLGAQKVALEVTCIIILILDMIWYMFINVTNAVKNIPRDIKEVGHMFGFKGIKRITHLIIPSIIPAIVTGSILSWGTGWNTIIFAEYLPSSDPSIPSMSVPGIGSLLDQAGYTYGNTSVLLILILVISTIVLSMEGLIWRRLLRRFEKYHVEI